MLLEIKNAAKSFTAGAVIIALGCCFANSGRDCKVPSCSSVSLLKSKHWSQSLNAIVHIVFKARLTLLSS